MYEGSLSKLTEYLNSVKGEHETALRKAESEFKVTEECLRRERERAIGGVEGVWVERLSRQEEISKSQVRVINNSYEEESLCSLPVRLSFH